MKRKRGMGLNPNYKVKPSIRELRKFIIKGKVVVVYSKKGAIKRLEHKK